MGKLLTCRKKRMTLITVHLPDRDLTLLDYLVRQNVFPSRSEAIRFAIKKLISEMLRETEYTNEYKKHMILGIR